jgi:hypothetical protein
MQLQQSVRNVFVQLSESLHHLSDEQYVKQSKTLFKATIGQHVRHIIELFVCLEAGYESGLVNYEKRKRDILIEKNKDFAQGAFTENIQWTRKAEQKAIARIKL